MTEEVQNVEAPTVETQAREMGWKPLEEFEGDRNKWVNAEIFVARAPLFEKIEADKKAHRREVEELKQAVKALADHNKNVSVAAYQQALQDLKAQKRAALEDGDTTKALQISEQIDEIRNNPPAIPQINTSPTPAIFVDWTNENPWYTSDPELRKEADVIGASLALRGLSPETVLKKVTEEIQSLFPEKFGKRKVVAPQTGEAPSKSGSSKKNDFSLSEEENRVMKKLVSLGAITEEKYKEDLRKIKGL